MLKSSTKPEFKLNLEEERYISKEMISWYVDFSGNKARKLYYYLVNEFPNIKRVVSYGSNQSNAYVFNI